MGVFKDKHSRKAFFWSLPIFFLIFGFFSVFDLLPQSVKSLFENSQNEAVASKGPNIYLVSSLPVDTRSEKIETQPGGGGSLNLENSNNYDNPVRITIPVIGVNASILNPVSQNISVLDNALLYGAVRYPSSGTLESSRNIFIFGHSTGLPVVRNQNFKTFNNLKNLKYGDTISLFSNEKEYRYKVSAVRLTMADEAFVTLSNERKLILSTCNTFGEKEERYLVEADFVRDYLIGS